MRWRVLALIACALLLGVAQPSRAQFATAETTYQYFVQFCMEGFPDIGKIRQATKDAGCPVASPSSEMVADWIRYDPANQISPYYIQTKRVGQKATCSLTYDERIRLPIQTLVERYTFQRNGLMSEQVSSWNPQWQYEIFSKTVDGEQWNLIWCQSRDGRSGHEIFIINFPVNQ